jgi:hypothetical protein
LLPTPGNLFKNDWLQAPNPDAPPAPTADWNDVDGPDNIAIVAEVRQTSAAAADVLSDIRRQLSTIMPEEDSDAHKEFLVRSKSLQLVRWQ